MRLVKSKFVKWLRSKPQTEIVGEHRDCHGCPIANFYYDASGGREIVIFQNDRGGYTIDRGYIKRKLPGWAEAFVFNADGEANGKISAIRALEIVGAQ